MSGTLWGQFTVRSLQGLVTLCWVNSLRSLQYFVRLVGLLTVRSLQGLVRLSWLIDSEESTRIGELSVQILRL